MAEVELWSYRLNAGAEEEISLPADVRLTNIAFGEELPDENGRSVIKLAYENILSSGDSDEESDEDEEKPQKKKKDEDEDEEDDDMGDIVVTVLTALTAGRTEQSTVNVVLKGERPYVLINTGKNPVYLTGNYIEHSDEPPYDSDEDDLDSDEEAYDLRDVSSDVEMDPHDLEGLDDLDTDASRFEEVDEEVVTKASKRPRDSDDVEEAPKKKDSKKNKKLKGADGQAVPAEAAATEVAAPEKKEKKEKKDKKEKKEAPAVKTLEGGLKIQDTKVGEGPEAKKGARIGVRYIGKLENGKIFDKNVKGKPFQFKLGKGEVIKGWDQGFAGMRVGGERILTVPAALGYGKKGAGSDIPPNATLRFEVKLLEVS